MILKITNRLLATFGILAEGLNEEITIRSNGISGKAHAILISNLPNSKSDIELTKIAANNLIEGIEFFTNSIIPRNIESDVSDFIIDLNQLKNEIKTQLDE